MIDNTRIDKVRLCRSGELPNKIVVVDGLIAGGKGLVSAIVSSIPGVEMWMHKPELEQICALASLGHISDNCASVMINSLCDAWSINLNLSREINFKWGEMSSMWRSRDWFRYCRNLLFSGSSFKAIDDITRNPRTIHLMTHALTAHATPLCEAVGNRLVFIRVVRCPASLYMVNHVARWIRRWDKTDPSQMIYCFKDENSGKKIPYHAVGLEDEYLSGNPIDRAVNLINYWIKTGNAMSDSLKLKGIELIEIPFEHFVFHPLPYIEAIAIALGSKVDKRTEREMRAQRVPRSSLTDAPYNRFYSALGWESPTSILTLDQEFEQAFDSVAKFGERSCSADRLREAAREYKIRYRL